MPFTDLSEVFRYVPFDMCSQSCQKCFVMFLSQKVAIMDCFFSRLHAFLKNLRLSVGRLAEDINSIVALRMPALIVRLQLVKHNVNLQSENLLKFCNRTC